MAMVRLARSHNHEPQNDVHASEQMTPRVLVGFVTLTLTCDQ